MKRGRTKYDDSEYLIFVTTSITSHLHVFNEPKLAIKALQLLEEVRKKYEMKIYSYCLMPNHIHMILQSKTKGNLSPFMKTWKALTARAIIKYAEAKDSNLLSKFRDSAKQYDSSLGGRQEHQVWVSRFDDLLLRSSEVMRTKVNYIHENPVKKGIVTSAEEFEYSSAGWYGGNGESLIRLTDIRDLLI